MEYHQRSSVCSGKLPFDMRVPFTFLPVTCKPKILAEQKVPQVGHNDLISSILVFVFILVLIVSNTTIEKQSCVFVFP